MDLFLLADNFAQGTQMVQEAATEVIPLPPEYILPAIVLVIATVFIFFFLKKIIVNSVLGVVALLAANFIFNMQLPWISSIVISIIFGPAGVGVMIVLRIFGVQL
jgi:hypothetical protein